MNASLDPQNRESGGERPAYVNWIPIVVPLFALFLAVLIFGLIGGEML